ncbi:MAG: hypothetical protein U9Q97_06325 [Acidobacteriota bacterium]|nr:hypothetical protein [Acidobacteriota bacterium]
MSIIDLYFVGKLGHVQIASLSIAGTVVAILVMLVTWISVEKAL